MTKQQNYIITTHLQRIPMEICSECPQLLNYNIWKHFNLTLKAYSMSYNAFDLRCDFSFKCLPIWTVELI